MEIRILHFYPDLMSLYGSYANVSILKRTLEAMGNSVTVERVELLFIPRFTKHVRVSPA